MCQAKPVVIVTLDGGPDENPWYTKTIECTIDYFVTQDLDALILTAIHLVGVLIIESTKEWWSSVQSSVEWLFHSITFGSSHLQVFLIKAVLKICSKLTGEHPCRSVISIRLQSNYIEITLWHGGSPVNLLHIFWTPFLKNTSGRLFLHFISNLNVERTYVPLKVFSFSIVGRLLQQYD